MFRRDCQRIAGETWISDEILRRLGSASSVSIDSPRAEQWGKAAIVSIFDSGCCYTGTRFGDASRRRRHPYRRVIPVFERIAVGRPA
jgi:hypothetical protein